MYSNRFQRAIRVTRHASLRMVKRNMDDSLRLDLIETGRAKYRDHSHLWLVKAYAGRSDNLWCAAVVREPVLVVKTVMHHFAIEA